MFLCKEAPGAIHCAVFMVAGEHFIASTQLQRARNDVHRDGHVLGVDQIVGMCPEVFTEHRARISHQACEAPA